MLSGSGGLNSSEESRKRLEKAAEIFRKVGAKRDLERVERKLPADV